MISLRSSADARSLRRTALHNLLVAKAAEVVNFRWGARVSEFAAAGARINGEYVDYRWLVGADGLNSSVAAGPISWAY
jgi:2-polyprenyl-6-methoxyphenol hydroxylase-like FAD-dependent oxidoreductase